MVAMVPLRPHYVNACNEYRIVIDGWNAWPGPEHNAVARKDAPPLIKEGRRSCRQRVNAPFLTVTHHLQMPLTFGLHTCRAIAFGSSGADRIASALAFSGVPVVAAPACSTNCVLGC